MAVMHKDRMLQCEISRSVYQNNEIKCRYFSADTSPNQKYFQLNMETSVSNIRFDRDTAIFLIDVLIKEFDLQADIKVSFK